MSAYEAMMSILHTCHAVLVCNVINTLSEAFNFFSVMNELRYILFSVVRHNQSENVIVRSFFLSMKAICFQFKCM